MAQNITLLGASYSAVPAVTLPKTGGGTASFTDVTDTTAEASDVASGKYFYTASGVRTQGTNSGGGGVDIPVFTLEYDANGIIVSKSCSETFAQCYLRYNDNFEMSAITYEVFDNGDGTSWETNNSLSVIEADNSHITYSAFTSAQPYFDIVYRNDGTIDVVNPSNYALELNVTQNGHYFPSSGFGAYVSVDVNVSGGSSPTLQNKTVSPSTSQQTVQADSGYDGLDTVTVNAMPSGTAGTPTATKGAVSNHSVSVTPSVTNTTGYITGSTKTGTAVTVSASELVSGSETKTENGTYDVTNLASLVVNVSGGTSKNVQVVQGTTRTTSSTLTAIGAEMTVAKTGTYNVYWSGVRTTTSGSYTYGTQLYVDGTAYGTQNTTWSNHVQNNHLTNVSLTANQKIRVYGRNSRGSSYYIYAPTLVIVES